MKKVILSLGTTALLTLGFSGAAFADTYKVQAGDTLWSISKKHNITVNQLKQWNDLSSTLIYPNQSLAVSKSETKTAKPTAQPKVKAAASTPAPSVVKELTVKATAYTASCAGCSGITATGINLKANPNQKVISVDPKVIPLGSKVYVEGYGEAIAGDTGSAVRGNKIDVFIPSKQRAIQWGVKTVKVKILK
ncbi:3D domain-containing protein [Metabacillus iocasae]|uniref:3D (Asp-Asp-Asp) domain-containing protein n=1 Tax=Priestia iocasae TaxID=2291674 RepID=A0ABS2QW30_9BACI|nr:3D domain-containing protein [Metabacillus iocasae]MBM7703693.1 3D (Asp-Asp-Asp) domain-containing protein [Metabacillus iocasae]